MPASPDMQRESDDPMKGRCLWTEFVGRAAVPFRIHVSNQSLTTRPHVRTEIAERWWPDGCRISLHICPISIVT